MPFADTGHVSAKFTAFNAAQMAKRAAEVDAEERAFEKKEKERLAAEAKKEAHAKRNRERRERLLAMGISKEDMRGIGLFEDENDDPSWCTQAHSCWMASGVRRYILRTIDRCRPKARVEVAPPSDERYIKGGATRHKCGHICLLWNQKKCCWCGDRRPVLQQAVQQKRSDEAAGVGKRSLFVSNLAENPELHSARNKERSREEEEEEGLPQLYPGYRDGAGWVPHQLTRDANYCRVCRHLGQDGRNLAALVAEEDAKDAVMQQQQQEADRVAAEKAEEERKLREAKELIRKMEDMASGVENSDSAIVLGEEGKRPKAGDISSSLSENEDEEAAAAEEMGLPLVPVAVVTGLLVRKLNRPSSASP